MRTTSHSPGPALEREPPRSVDELRARVQQLGAELDTYLLPRVRTLTVKRRHLLEDARTYLSMADRALEAEQDAARPHHPPSSE